jgi:hypothetical protein
MAAAGVRERLFFVGIAVLLIVGVFMALLVLFWSVGR